MNIKEAVELLIKKYPGRVPKGYWIKGDEIIIQTKPLPVFKKIPTPYMFAVTKDGQVYGGTPMYFNVDPKLMKKI